MATTNFRIAFVDCATIVIVAVDIGVTAHTDGAVDVRDALSCRARIGSRANDRSEHAAAMHVAQVDRANVAIGALQRNVLDASIRIA